MGENLVTHEQMTHHEGFHPPRYCPRGRRDCQSLAQIISTGHATFICCGENDGTERRVSQDRYRFCQQTRDGVDVMTDHDARDLAHIAACVNGALAVALEEMT
jgi:hypothetical protein